MIDTDKYEGHTPGPWEAELDDTDGHMYVAIAEGDEKREVFLDLPCWVCEEDMLELTATAELIADAPLLLAEVKRLREAFITAVRHVGEHDLSRDDLFSELDEDLFSLWFKFWSEEE